MKMTAIFNTYTGNAMLNNALMTIEALGKLNSISEITPSILLEQYKKQDLRAINKRLKSYTMLFSLNNPLVNPAKKQDDAGEKTYHHLLMSILNKFENVGSKVCEISGLNFETSFEDFYRAEIDRQKEAIKLKKLDQKEEKKALSNLENTDLSLNRSWFPLIGGLGSDAQALPQAKFTIQIHPICIVIMQFLPLAAFLYKGGVLLIDSSNFDFSREFIAGNVKDLQERIKLVSSTTASIENVRDYNKGNYISKALKILEEKNIDDIYSDLNLWSFSNSGTGASCEIDRVPNALIKKLIQLKKVPNVAKKIDEILSKNESSYSFLESLEDNKEWWLLYPNVFGSGKKAVEYEGVSVEFLENYFKVIGSEQDIINARYLAYLINKYKSKSFEKYLIKTDAWNEKEYRTDLFVVLAEATKNGEWDLYNHIQLLDNANELPVKNQFYKIHKITHFYYQNKVFINKRPVIETKQYQTLGICKWLISLIQNDEKGSSIIKDLISTQEYKTVSYQGLFLRQASSMTLNSILFFLYDEELKPNRYAINELLHLFFLQPNQEIFELSESFLHKNIQLSFSTVNWIDKIEKFSQYYQSYYLAKYSSNKKLITQISNIPDNTTQFLRWFEEAVENTNQFLKETETTHEWSETLLYNPSGEFSPTLARFIFKFLSLKEKNQIEVKLV